MSMQKAFAAAGKSILVVANPTAPLGVQAAPTGVSRKRHYRVYNDGNEAVALGWGATDSAAQTNADFPTGGNPKDSIVIPPGDVEIFTAPADSYWSGKSVSVNCNVYITPGEGV